MKLHGEEEGSPSFYVVAAPSPHTGKGRGLQFLPLLHTIYIGHHRLSAYCPYAYSACSDL
ncbi:hypothetical protein O3M35_006845 [Rhynocoris fuscipes]|uniref:Uncharacterized protein n=1 Tax=Rhynocoris fuscipes TaxID=488301 RepID=A0AAW1DFH7_9HEMI